MKAMGAEIVNHVTLPLDEKRIDIENNLYHARAMINDKLYRADLAALRRSKREF